MTMSSLSLFALYNGTNAILLEPLSGVIVGFSDSSSYTLSSLGRLCLILRYCLAPNFYLPYDPYILPSFE